MTPRHYAREFKREAVHLIVNRSVSVAQAARDLDLHPSLLWRWTRQFNESGDEVSPVKAS
jgi:transposase